MHYVSPPMLHTRLCGGRQGWHYLNFTGGETKAQRGKGVKPEVTNRVSGRAQPGAQLAPSIRPPDHLPLPQEAAAARRVERGLGSRAVLGSMLGAPTYQLHDLGQVASSLCPSLLARETRTQRPPRRALWSPSAQLCNGAESAVSGAPTPTRARQRQKTVVTVTNTNSRRPPAARPVGATPTWLPRPRAGRSLSRSRGRGAGLPPRPPHRPATESAIFPATPGPRSGRQLRLSPRPAQTWLPSGPARPGVARPAPRFREAARAEPGRCRGRRGGAKGPGAETAAKRERKSAACLVMLGAPGGLRPRPSRINSQWAGAPRPIPPRAHTPRHTPGVKTSQLFNLHVSHTIPLPLPDPLPQRPRSP